MSEFLRPIPLASDHDGSGFRSGNEILDAWLAGRAMRNQRSGASRTFVTTRHHSTRILGYYCLAASSIRLGETPGIVRRNMPDPVPVILLGRLAIDRAVQGLGLGRALLEDATRRVLAAGDTIGVRALLVHAIDDRAANFYRHFGFVASPHDDATLFLPMTRIRASSR